MQKKYVGSFFLCCKMKNLEVAHKRTLRVHPVDPSCVAKAFVQEQKRKMEQRGTDDEEEEGDDGVCVLTYKTTIRVPSLLLLLLYGRRPFSPGRLIFFSGDFFSFTHEETHANGKTFWFISCRWISVFFFFDVIGTRDRCWTNQLPETGIPQNASTCVRLSELAVLLRGGRRPSNCNTAAMDHTRWRGDGSVNAAIRIPFLFIE